MTQQFLGLGVNDFTGGDKLESRLVNVLLFHALAFECLMMGASGSEPINCNLLPAVVDTFLDDGVCARHVGQFEVGKV